MGSTDLYSPFSRELKAPPLAHPTVPEKMSLNASMHLSDTLPDPPVHSSLSDLSLAVFLDSLYKLEIAPSDGLTPGMLESLQLGTAVPDAVSVQGLQSTPSSLPYAESTFLQENLFFSVPSDMRWWNAAWMLPKVENEDTAPPLHANLGTCIHAAEEVPSDVTSPAATPLITPLAHKAMTPPTPKPLLKHTPSSSGCTGFATTKGCCSHTGVSSPPPSCCVGPPLPHARNTVSSEKHAHNIDKVHCVPDPTGTECSCKCDSGVALLSLERSLKKSSLHPSQDLSDARSDASSSLVFTLNMSQSIAKQCTCSADCPTCKRDPSYKTSAGLLISTALQIYARALKVFHEVFVSDTNKCWCSGRGMPCSCAQKRQHDETSIDVRIGDYWPSTVNARKIALYAMKLELVDLERALARVQSAASCPLSNLSTNDTASSEEQEQALRLNPIDQLVIRKLHQQLNEVLHAVEDLENEDSRGSDTASCHLNHVE